MDKFLRLIHAELLPQLKMESTHPNEPVVVHSIPEPWHVLGAGNYAAVVTHPEYPDLVLKQYAPGREGWEDEVEVYTRLGKHQAYAQCHHSDGANRCLVLSRLRGWTLYECVKRGIRIPEQAIRDVDDALAYARERGLHPHDVHGKNVMVAPSGRGIVVDVSDFLKDEPCNMWQDMKKAYYKVYFPYMHNRPVPVPDVFLNGVRKGYRWFRRGKDFLGSGS